jgi:hypothetical protein
MMLLDITILFYNIMQSDNMLVLGCPRKWLFEIPRNTEFYAEVTSIPRNSAEVQSA